MVAYGRFQSIKEGYQPVHAKAGSCCRAEAASSVGKNETEEGKTEDDVYIVHAERIGIMTLSGSSLYRYRGINNQGYTRSKHSSAPMAFTFHN
jgi:hypothetical protein